MNQMHGYREAIARKTTVLVKIGEVPKHGLYRIADSDLSVNITRSRFLKTYQMCANSSPLSFESSINGTAASPSIYPLPNESRLSKKRSKLTFSAAVTSQLWAWLFLAGDEKALDAKAVEALRSGKRAR